MSSCEYRGGLKRYDRARQDIATWLREDSNPDARFTTMFDLYALPDDFPGFAEATRRPDPYAKVTLLERAMDADVADPRFLSYIQLHEFEALIFAEPKTLLEEYFERETEIQCLLDVLENHHNNPELIDDGRDTAPSKRILDKIPEYDKATAGPDLAARIGIDHLRQRCRHFGEWLNKLENLT